MKDRLILGIKDRVLKDRLLGIKDLTLTQALEVCRASETTFWQLQDICPVETSDGGIHIIKHQFHSSDSSSRRSTGMDRSKSAGRSQTAATVNNKKHGRPPSTGYVCYDKQRSSSNMNFKCNKCGYVHNFAKCPEYGRKCATCAILNNFANQCRIWNVNIVYSTAHDSMFSASFDFIHYVSTKNRKQ